MWVNYDELQIKFNFRSTSLIFAEITGFGLWEIVENHSYTDFFSKHFQILDRFLVCELTMMSYRSSLSFVPLRLFSLKLRALDFLLKITVIRIFSLFPSRFWADFWYVKLPSCLCPHVFILKLQILQLFGTGPFLSLWHV